MRKLIFLCLMLATLSAFAQKEKKVKSKRLTKVEAADMTREQKLVHESQRKGGKSKNVGMEKKVKMAKKQDKKAKRTKTPKPRKRKDN